MKPRRGDRHCTALTTAEIEAWVARNLELFAPARTFRDGNPRYDGARWEGERDSRETTMRHFATFARALFMLVLAPAPALAIPVAMTPDPLGDWVILDRIADVSLQSGETSPVPTLVLRTRVIGGGPSGNTTVNFDFDFDVDVSSASVSSSTGSFGIAPFVNLAAGDVLVAFTCAPSPCEVDVTFEFATTPATLDVTDTINQFVHSPGAPVQTLTATFAPVASAPALGLAGLIVLGAGLVVAGRRASRRRRSANT